MFSLEVLSRSCLEKLSQEALVRSVGVFSSCHEVKWQKMCQREKLGQVALMVVQKILFSCLGSILQYNVLYDMAYGLTWYGTWIGMEW